jgi:hypothetical protein
LDERLDITGEITILHRAIIALVTTRAALLKKLVSHFKKPTL